MLFAIPDGECIRIPAKLRANAERVFKKVIESVSQKSPDTATLAYF